MARHCCLCYICCYYNGSCMLDPSAGAVMIRTFPLHIYTPAFPPSTHTPAAGPAHAPNIPLCNIRRGKYSYTDDLLALGSQQPRPQHPGLPQLQHIITPLQVERWETHLDSHPDQVFVQYLLGGIRDGFRIGTSGSHGCRQAKRNLRSAYEHPEIIAAYFTCEMQLGQAIRLPLAASLSLPNLQISPFGVIPKRNRPDKWRLIVDLSSPEGFSVNDELDRALCSITYSSVDDAVAIIRTLGPGALLAKLDLREAYRIVPVHPEDRPRLGVRWRNDVYIDAAHPFGLRSAPKFFGISRRITVDPPLKGCTCHYTIWMTSSS